MYPTEDKGPPKMVTLVGFLSFFSSVFFSSLYESQPYCFAVMLFL